MPGSTVLHSPTAGWLPTLTPLLGTLFLFCLAHSYSSFRSSAPQEGFPDQTGPDQTLPPGAEQACLLCPHPALDVVPPSLRQLFPSGVVQLLGKTLQEKDAAAQTKGSPRPLFHQRKPATGNCSWDGDVLSGKAVCWECTAKCGKTLTKVKNGGRK